MWGDVHLAKEHFNTAAGHEIKKLVADMDHDVVVDKVARDKGIFEGCKWMPFVSQK